MNISSTEPKAFTVGNSLEWKRYVEDYPPRTGWQLFYSFRNFESSFNVAAVSKKDYYLVRLPSKKTTEFKPGIYWWQLTAAKDDEWKVIQDGKLEVKPNLALLDSYDGRSHVKQVLDNLEAMILGKASRDQMSYSISGRSLSRLSPTELLKWRDIYKAEYTRELQQERLNQGLGNNRIIKVRFGNY